jgi:hypothetical protein
MEYLLLLQLVSPYKYSRRLSAILAVIWTIMWIIGFDGTYNFSAPAAAAASSTAAGPGRMWRSIERRLVNEDLSSCQNLVPSPNLEKFVDELPIPKSIHIDNGTQITLGAYKITQVLTLCPKKLLKEYCCQIAKAVLELLICIDAQCGHSAKITDIVMMYLLCLVAEAAQGSTADDFVRIRHK